MKETRARRITFNIPALLSKCFHQGRKRIDKGEKLDTYLEYPSIEEYMLVGSQKKMVEVYHRDGDTWVSRRYKPDSLIHLRSIEVSIPFEDIYEKTGLILNWGVLIPLHVLVCAVCGSAFHLQRKCTSTLLTSVPVAIYTGFLGKVFHRPLLLRSIVIGVGHFGPIFGVQDFFCLFIDESFQILWEISPLALRQFLDREKKILFPWIRLSLVLRRS